VSWLKVLTDKNKLACTHCGKRANPVAIFNGLIAGEGKLTPGGFSVW
jgi:hypothetical protein